MRIIDKKLVESVKWNGDIKEYDLKLSQLCQNGQSFIVVNPELDIQVIDLIDIDIPETQVCVKYKLGDTWLAKRFPAQWNGEYYITTVSAKPKTIKFSNYVEKKNKGILDYTPTAWDLQYTHSWIYDKALTGGIEIDAITINYVNRPTGKKIIDTVAINNLDSVFDVFFLSYNEQDAEDNWKRLKTVCPRAKRLSGIKGIYKAHKTASDLSTTEMFYIVDADAYIDDNFRFNFSPVIQERNMVHIWYGRNPINGLEYGYGGVKLFPTEKFKVNELNVVDIATSLGDLRVHEELSCETRFNTDAFSTWRSAVRECAKLSAKVIYNQNDAETEQRLNIWTTVGKDQLFGEYALHGAEFGKKYGMMNRDSLHLINDYVWLKNKFDELTANLNI